MKKSDFLGGLALAGALGLAASANASSPPLPGPTNDGVWVVSDGTTVAFLNDAETTQYFSALQAFNTPSGFVAGIVNMLPGGNEGEPLLAGGLSDQFAMTVVSGHVDIHFISEGASASEIATFDAATAGLTVLGSVVETGHWQDVSSFYGQGLGFASISSDVPEPQTWSLMLVGFGLAGAAVRRRGFAAKA